jgi:hypothetical protein
VTRAHVPRQAAATSIERARIATETELKKGAQVGVRSHGRFARPRIRFASDLRRCSVPLVLKRQCDRTLNLKFTGLTQNLGQLKRLV